MKTMSDHHVAKHVFGELTFGEYWNLFGCHAFCVKVWGRNCLAFEPYQLFEQMCVRFRLSSYLNHDEESVFVPLESKVKVEGHKVRVKDNQGQEILLEFYELSPLESFQ